MKAPEMGLFLFSILHFLYQSYILPTFNVGNYIDYLCFTLFDLYIFVPIN